MFEFHPYEYGSWDSGISAFAQTKYMVSPNLELLSIAFHEMIDY